MTLIRYGLLSWRKPLPEVNDQSTFSFWRNSNWNAILLGIILLLCFEGFAFHFLLAHWSVWLVTIHGVLSVYSILWLLSDYQAIRHHPFRVTENDIAIQIGFRWSLKIPMKDVASIEFGGSPEKVDEPKVGEFVKTAKVPGYQTLTLFEEPELLIRFKRPLEARGMFGMSKRLTQIGIAPDQPEAFKKSVEAKLTAQNAENN